MDAVIERHRVVLRNLKYTVLCGRISGVQYQTVSALVRAEAARERLIQANMDSIMDDVERSVDYTQPRTYAAPFD
jgi:hypothetical protein